MANPQVDVLKHTGAMSTIGKKAKAALCTAQKFSECKAVDRLLFWPEEFDEVCNALKGSGLRADGFYVGYVKIIRYNERG